MKIRFLHSIAGGINFNAGDIGDIPDTDAKRLIVAGIAEAIRKAAPATALEVAINPAATIERVAILPEGQKPKGK